MDASEPMTPDDNIEHRLSHAPGFPGAIPLPVAHLGFGRDVMNLFSEAETYADCHILCRGDLPHDIHRRLEMFRRLVRKCSIAPNPRFPPPRTIAWAAIREFVQNVVDGGGIQFAERLAQMIEAESVSACDRKSICREGPYVMAMRG